MITNDENRLGDFSTKDLKLRTLRGGSIVFINMFIQKGFLLAFYAILARLLSPRDYGIFGMVFAINIFLSIFSSGGLTQATVQKYDLNHQQLSTIFWLNVALGIALGVVMASTSPLLVWFYNEPVLINVTLLMALAFPLGAIGSQPGALLARQMAFGKSAFSQSFSLIAGGTIGIILALNGYGIYSLVFQILVQTITRSFANFFFCNWVPSLPVRGSGVRKMLKFGGYLTGFSFISYLSSNLDKILIGRISGATSLGLYTRAYAIMMFPVGIISEPANAVMSPVLSRLQNNKYHFNDVCLNLINIIGFFVFPIMFWLILSHREIILFLYGKKWLDSAPIFAILCIAGIFQCYHFIINQIYLAAGLSSRQFFIGVLSSSIISLSFLIGSFWGLRGVSISFSIGHAILFLPYLYYFCKTFFINIYFIIRQMFFFLTASLIMFFIQKFINIYFSTFSFNLFVFIFLSFLSSSVIYLFLSFIFSKNILSFALINLRSFLKRS